MEISVELTLTPLQDNYEAPIIAFIKELRASGFSVIETPLSTQIYGNYNKLMPFLNQAINNSFSALDRAVLTLKIVKGNRSDYEPHF